MPLEGTLFSTPLRSIKNKKSGECIDIGNFKVTTKALTPLKGVLKKSWLIFPFTGVVAVSG